MTFLKMTDVDLAQRRVFIRVDFNVPLDEHNHVSDDTRIRAALPTLEYLAERGACVIVLSHLGRPKGKPELKYSLEPVSRHLARLTPRRVRFVETTDSDEHEFRPALAARDGKPLEPGHIPQEDEREGECRGAERGDEDRRESSLRALGTIRGSVV